MKYYAPKDVKSPRRCISSVTPLYDGGTDNAFSLAKITWQGKECIGIRWNVTQGEWDDENKINGTKICVGEPNSRGYPTWFILPNEFLKALLTGKGEISEAIRETLESIDSLNDEV